MNHRIIVFVVHEWRRHFITMQAYATARAWYARAVLGVVILSVRPSIHLFVCLSHAWIVTNLNAALQIFLYHTKGQFVIIELFSLSLMVATLWAEICRRRRFFFASTDFAHNVSTTLLLWHQQWLVGDAPLPLKSEFKVTHPLRKTPTLTDFRS